MKFRTVYDRVRIFSAPGERDIPQYKLHVDPETGVRDLKQYGKIDGYAKIQSYKDSCDVNYIIERFANGDTTALERVQGVYGDFTHMPRTMAELSQRVLDAEQMFYQLPLEVREKFNHDPSQFFAQIGTDRYNEIFKDQKAKLDAEEAAKAAAEFDEAVQDQIKFDAAVEAAKAAQVKTSAPAPDVTQ